MKAEQSYLQEYYMIKKSVSLPTKLKIYFGQLQASYQNKYKQDTKLSDHKEFFMAFNKLSLSQKAQIMNQNIKFVVRILFQQNNKKNIETLIRRSNNLMKIQTSANISSTRMKIPCWAEVKFRLDKNQRNIAISSFKKTTHIQLSKYLVRRSKKIKNAIILELADQSDKNDRKKFTFQFESPVVQLFYKQILSVVLQIRNQILYKMLQQSNPSGKQNGAKALVLLSPKNINVYLKYKQKIQKYLLSGKFDFKTILKQQTNSLRIEQSQSNGKVFKMESIFDINSEDLKQIFMQSFQNNNQYILSSEILQSFSKNKYQATYQKYFISGKTQQLISIKQVIMTKQKKQTEETFLFMMGVQNIMVKNFVQFFTAKSRPINQISSKLIVVCEFMIDKVITPLIVQNFLKQISDMIGRNHQKTMQIQQQFYTVYGNTFINQQAVEFIEADEQYKGQLVLDNFKQTEELSSIKIQYLHKKYKLNPYSIQEYNPSQNLMKQHYLFKQWQRAKEGGVVCINQAIINQQKKIFKHIITTFGNNILKGNSILNISLPVNIFKRQSHLQSIARDFCYAPLLLENVNHPLQRVKRTTILAISIGTLGISMDKPFNPILGETLQVWIGGCPMYLEQISHHPPIGAYLFIGRGFRIHGLIEPKISFGMNNVKGYSQRPNYVVFDDGTQIQLIFGKMVINGMLFGQRMFDFTDKIYAYDKTNNIFSEINYGPRKKNIIMKNSQPKDFIYGKIYKVKPEFRNKFETYKPCAYPSKEYIIQQLTQFQGRWTQKILFQRSPYIDFMRQLPCRIEDEKNPIPSNSHYRKDLSNLIDNKIEQAQKQKQILEQIQRRDRKLRQSFNV